MRSKILREIQTIHHLANGALLGGSITEVLRQAADSIAGLLPADRVSIIGFNAPGETVDYQVQGGKGKGDIEREVPYGELWEGLSGWVLSKGIPALSPKGKPDARESAVVQARRAATNCGSIVVVPVKNVDGYLATITAINRPEQRDFDKADVEILTVFSISVAVLIENARLLADLQLSRDLAEISRVQLAEQNRMKDKLFTILAHDLRGPVGTLSVLLGFLAETPMDADTAQNMLREGQKSAIQTFSLLENLLGWVRSQMEEVKVLHTRFAARKSLIAVQLWLEAQARTKGITLRVECSETLTVEGDERMFETIVRNLVSNAVKYSVEDTVVTLRAAYRGDEVVVEVVDHGVGIPPEKLQTLFGHHDVSSEVGTGGERGSGLGLMFCSDLARTLGGRLEAESVPGSGSTFRLILPDPVGDDLG